VAEFNPILSSAVKAYRHKEAVPKQFDSGAVVRTAQAAGYAVQIGMPRIGLDSLAARMLTEGREDAGVNEYNTDNPKAKEMFDKMRSAGFDQKQAAYAAAVVDKDMVAKRLGIPFDEAWNGTGTSRYGRTGAQHAARSSQQLEAPNDPKNADFKSYVERAASGKLTKEEKLAVASPRDIAEAIYGILGNSNDLTSFGKDNMSRALIHEYSKIAPTDPGMRNVREKGPHMGGDTLDRSICFSPR